MPRMDRNSPFLQSVSLKLDIRVNTKTKRNYEITARRDHQFNLTPKSQMSKNWIWISFLKRDISEFKCFQLRKNSLSLDPSLKTEFILTELQDKSTKRDNQLNLLTPMSKASNASNGIRDKTKVKASTDIFSYASSSRLYPCQ